MNILLLAIAIILSIPVFCIGFIFNIFTFKKGRFFWFSAFKMTYEVVLIFYDLFLYLATALDKLGNVIGGNMFITLFVKKGFQKETLFCKNECTISASLGKGIEKQQLNNAGMSFVYFLLIFVKDNHFERAYQWYILKRDFKNQ